jgi:hypothetical protein
MLSLIRERTVELALGEMIGFTPAGFAKGPIIQGFVWASTGLPITRKSKTPTLQHAKSITPALGTGRL